MSTPEITTIFAFAGHGFGLLLIAVLGTLIALTNWLRLLLWHRLSTVLWQAVLAHSVLLAPVAWLSSLDYGDLLLWDAAIFAACYISYCVYLAYARTSYLARINPRAFNQMSRLSLAAELILCFLDRLVYRAIYSWSDIAPAAERPQLPRRF